MEIAAWILLATGLLAFIIALVGMSLDSGDGVIACAFALCFVGLVGGATCAAIQSSADWDKFAAEHACVKVGHMSGSTFNTVGVGSNGGVSVGIGSTPDKTGYQCNDGVTYWR